MVAFAQKICVSVKTAYLRITLTRFTLAFFLFSFVHFLVQGLIQSFLYEIDYSAHQLIANILYTAKVPTADVPLLSIVNSGFNLKVCNGLPLSPAVCFDVFQNGLQYERNLSFPASFRRGQEADEGTLHTLARRTSSDAVLDPFFNTAGDLSGVTLTYNDGRASVFLNEQCTRVLLYPEQILSQTRQEEISLVGSQFWIFLLSFFALISESTPHVIAVFCMRVLSTGWSAYTIWRTRNMEHRFHRLMIDTDTPCHFDLLPGYFEQRSAFQIPDLILSCTALLLTAYYGWSLIRDYSKHTFKCAGPPAKVVRIYRWFLAELVCLKLVIFLMATAMGLWADALASGAIAVISTHTRIYRALYIFTFVTLIPWAFMGWFAIRKERKTLMAPFLVLCLFYIASWSIMFYSQVYRLEWVQWPFFAIMSVSSFIGLVAVCVVGAVCWLNFDQGLAHYLYVEEVLANSNFEPQVFSNDTEKAMPLQNRYSAFQPSFPSSSPTVKQDSNWDFADTTRPPIYIVQLNGDKDTYR